MIARRFIAAAEEMGTPGGLFDAPRTFAHVIGDPARSIGFLVVAFSAFKAVAALLGGGAIDLAMGLMGVAAGTAIMRSARAGHSPAPT